MNGHRPWGYNNPGPPWGNFPAIRTGTAESVTRG